MDSGVRRLWLFLVKLYKFLLDSVDSNGRAIILGACLPLFTDWSTLWILLGSSIFPSWFINQDFRTSFFKKVAAIFLRHLLLRLLSLLMSSRLLLFLKSKRSSDEWLLPNGSSSSPSRWTWFWKYHTYPDGVKNTIKLLSSEADTYSHANLAKKPELHFLITDIHQMWRKEI